MGIDKSDIEQRRQRLTDILSQITQHAQQQALLRCPYRDAEDRCTAKFGCRYRRRSAAGGLPICTHDGTLDYRAAWETDPQAVARAKERLRAQKQQRRAGSTVIAGDVRCELRVGQSLFEHADRGQLRVPSSCGRTGICHECVVEIRQGAESLSPPTAAESFCKRSYRLACQAVVESSAEVEFTALRRVPRILTEQQRRERPLDPAVRRVGEQVCWYDEPIDAYRGGLLGLAVDVGTTTVVAELLDLETGESRYLTSFENPQRFGGSDVLNRISYDGGEFQGELHRAIINTLNGEIEQLCRALEIDRQWIYELCVVGNSTMRDLFFGLDVQPIGERPYRSTTEAALREGRSTSTTLVELARKLRIRANKRARVYGGPLIASHVGADTAAALVAVDAASRDEYFMLVDIGTNTEVVLGNRQRLLAASCPAGPAFEGGLVQFGMPACAGAIESVRYRDGVFEYRTIDDAPPQGFCGSGLIELLAELKRSGQMGPKGVFQDKQTILSVVPEFGITFSRQDASHLAQAKAANYCGQRILLEQFPLAAEQISTLYLAGGFAHYVDVEAAIEIGFLPGVAAERVVKLGNAASQGARELLLSRSLREQTERLVKSIEHVELETVPNFFDHFVEGCMF